jgi:hypothetical protein
MAGTYRFLEKRRRSHGSDVSAACTRPGLVLERKGVIEDSTDSDRLNLGVRARNLISSTQQSSSSVYPVFGSPPPFDSKNHALPSRYKTHRRPNIQDNTVESSHRYKKRSEHGERKREGGGDERGHGGGAQGPGLPVPLEPRVPVVGAAARHQ